MQKIVVKSGLREFRKIREQSTIWKECSYEERLAAITAICGMSNKYGNVKSQFLTRISSVIQHPPFVLSIPMTV